MRTDTSEKGLKTLIMRHLASVDGLLFGASGQLAEAKPIKGGSGWFDGRTTSYEREFAVDVEQLFAFLRANQREETANRGIGDYKGKKNIVRLQGEASRRGTINVEVPGHQTGIRPGYCFSVASNSPTFCFHRAASSGRSVSS